MTHAVFRNEYIITSVFKYLDQHSLSQVCGVCRLWWAVGVPILYRSPVLANEESFLLFIMTLAESFQFSFRWDDTLKQFVSIQEQSFSMWEANEITEQRPASEPEFKFFDVDGIERGYYCAPIKVLAELHEEYRKPEKFGYRSIWWPTLILYYKENEGQYNSSTIYCVKREDAIYNMACKLLDAHHLHYPRLQKRQKTKYCPRAIGSLNGILSSYLQKPVFIPVSLCHFVKILDMSAVHNRWSWVSGNMGSMLLQFLFNLQHIDISHCHNIFPTDICKWAKLYANKVESMVFCDTHINNESLETISSGYFPKLKSMDLSETHVDDEGISCLTSERYPKLEYLSLDSLDISDDGINSIFAGLPKIRYISIENTIVRDTLDTVIALNDKYEWVDVNSSDSDSDSDE